MAVGTPTLNSVIPIDGGATLSWDAVVGANGYTVKYGTVSGTYTTEIDAGNVVTYTVTGLTNGTTYYFVVVARTDKIYLKFEGTDGSQTFVESAQGFTVTPYGNFQIDTSQYAVGNSSGFSVAQEGSSDTDYLVITRTSPEDYFGVDFVFEFRVRFNTVPSEQGAGGQVGQFTMLDIGSVVGTDFIEFSIINNALYCHGENGIAADEQKSANYTNGFQSGIWYHIKYKRVGSNIYFYVNNELIGTESISSPDAWNGGSSLNLFIGQFVGGAETPSGYGGLDGWLDEYRIGQESSDSTEISTTYISSSEGYCEYVEGGEIRKMVESVSGLDHLEGETIEIQMDGVLPTDDNGVLIDNAFTVASGAITLPKPAAVVHAGLPYDGTLQLVKQSDGSAQGTGQTKMRRVFLSIARFFKSLGLKVGLDEDNLSPIFLDTPSLPLYTGDKEKLPITNWRKDTELLFKIEDPLPCHILAILLESEVEEL